MNLNFYPNDYTQPNINPYNQFQNFNNLNNNFNNNLNNLNNNINQYQQNLENKLGQFFQNVNQAPNNQQQPYYLFCGNKNDWDEFLLLHYGTTEQNIFNDYKLFLQAKQELIEEQGQNKINTMKDKIKNKDMFTTDNILKSNVKPAQQFTNEQPNIQRNDSSINNGDISELNNGLCEQIKSQTKNSNRKK